MNRTLFLGIAIFLTLVTISLIGGERTASAGFGCQGWCSGCSCFGSQGCHGVAWCSGRGRCFGCQGGLLCWGRNGAYGCQGCHGYYASPGGFGSPNCVGCAGCSGCHGCQGCYGQVESDYPINAWQVSESEVVYNNGVPIDTFAVHLDVAAFASEVSTNRPAVGNLGYSGAAPVATDASRFALSADSRGLGPHGAPEQDSIARYGENPSQQKDSTIAEMSFDSNDPASPGRATDQRLQTTLAVRVPDDARVYINGQPTRSTGSDRFYLASGLTSGLKYAYEIRAEIDRGGQVISQQKTVAVGAGEASDVRFDFDATDTNIQREVRLPDRVW